MSEAERSECTRGPGVSVMGISEEKDTAQGMHESLVTGMHPRGSLGLAVSGAAWGSAAGKSSDELQVGTEGRWP